MWLLFHKNAKTRPVPGGRTVLDKCPECARTATFIEVEVEENIGLFFIDILGDKQRAFRCGACGSTFDLKDQPPPAPAAKAAPVKSAAEIELEREAARTAQAAAAKAKSAQIDDELTALKKKLGKKP